MKITTALFIASLTALGLNGCSGIAQSFYSEITRKENVYPSADHCKECHVDIHREWSESAHARAYSSEKFRRNTDDYRFRSCLPCHTPDSIFREGAVQARETLSEEGVTCAACHLLDGKYVGPLEPSALVLPHPVEMNTYLYRSSELCGKCHEGTLAEWQNAPGPEKKTCQECHMKAIDRKATQATGFVSGILVAYEKESRMRRHRFDLSAIEDLEDAFDCAAATVAVTAKAKSMRLVVKNKIPHRVPTGDFGFREVVLTVRALGGDGEELAVITRSYFKELGTAFPPKSEQEELVEVPPATESLSVSLTREGRTSPVSLYTKKIKIK